MKKVIISPVGDNSDSIFIGIREFVIEKVILVSPKNKLKKAHKLQDDLEKFKIESTIIELDRDYWENIFGMVAQIKRAEEGKELLINVAGADREMQCIFTSAAFVNGIKAFDIDKDQVMILPVLKFSYYKLISDKKMKILETIMTIPGSCESMEQLSKKTKMSLPLVSYHLNGSQKSEGLKTMGLIITREYNGRTEIELSPLGRLLLKGHVDIPKQK